jgi:hypothetical protein
MSTGHSLWTRRQALARGLRLLGLALAPAPLLGLPRLAHALGDATKLDVVELSMGSGSISRPSSWLRLLYEVDQTTSVVTLPRVVELGPDDPALFDHPLAVLVGDDALPELDEASIQQLARYLQYGGFLFIDDCSGVSDSAFDAFFLVERPLGRVEVSPWLEGVSVGEVTPLIYCRNDLSGALARGADGRDAFPVVPGGAMQRREAIKLGINLVLYALTSNYKHDMTHVRQLLEDGRIAE